jgi:hypothetical protein
MGGINTARYLIREIETEIAVRERHKKEATVTSPVEDLSTINSFE